MRRFQKLFCTASILNNMPLFGIHKIEAAIFMAVAEVSGLTGEALDGEDVLYVSNEICNIPVRERGVRGWQAMFQDSLIHLTKTMPVAVFRKGVRVLAAWGTVGLSGFALVYRPMEIVDLASNEG